MRFSGIDRVTTEKSKYIGISRPDDIFLIMRVTYLVLYLSTGIHEKKLQRKEPVRHNCKLSQKSTLKERTP